MSNAFRRAEGLDEDPGDVIGCDDFAAVVKCHRAFVRDVREHVRASAGNLNRYRRAIRRHADETATILDLHLHLWREFNDERPN